MYTVDASVWVNAFDQREPGHLVSRQFLEMLRNQALPIVVPSLVLAEVAGAISRTRHMYKHATKPGTVVVPHPKKDLGKGLGECDPRASWTEVGDDHAAPDPLRSPCPS